MIQKLTSLDELVIMMYESNSTLHQQKRGQRDNRKRHSEIFEDNFIRNCMKSIFSGNMTVARFLNDFAEIDDDFKENNEPLFQSKVKMKILMEVL